MSEAEELTYLRKVVKLLEAKNNDNVQLELLRAKTVAAKSMGG